MNVLTKQRFLILVKKPVACWLGLHLFLAPALSLAGAQIPGFYGNAGRPAPASGALPSAQQLSGSGFAIALPGNSQLVVNQTSANVVIDWNSFDIGSAASVVFNQKNSAGTAQPSWTALNRIHDANPSQIFGSLKSDGTVYLLNQNGFLFGPGSTVNVGGLIASTLNVRPDDVVSGVLKFRSEDFNGQPLADSAQNTAVSNFGSITTSEGGAVYLVAPIVENGGSIVAPYGNVGLVAAVPFTASNPRPVNSTDAQSQLDYDVKIDTSVASPTVSYHQYLSGGTATNLAGGQIVTDAGKTGMYGAFVNQDGLIRATTVVKKNGVIELLADHTVTTGAGSVTSSPVSDSSDTVDSSFLFSGGSVTLGGLKRDSTLADTGDIVTGSAAPSLINHQGLIEAPSGLVNLVATDRVFLGDGSVINVSGIWSDRDASAGIVTATLNSVNLADNPTQKGSALQGSAVSVNQSSGSSIGNVSGYLGSAPMTAQQLAQNGGSVVLGFNLPGDTHLANVTSQVVVMPGAEIDFQGGGIRYLGGAVNTTKLLSGNSIYDISSAPSNLTYDLVLGSQTVSYAKFGVSQTYSGLYLGGNNALNNYCSSYLQGSDAGSLSLLAGQVVLNGSLNGSYAKGLLQTKYQDAYNSFQELNGVGLIEPAGGSLSIGEDKNVSIPSHGLVGDFETSNVVVTSQVQPLGASFSAGDALPDYYQGKTLISAAIVNKAGLSNLSLYSNDSITIEKGAAITLVPFIRQSSDPTTGAVTTTSAGFSATARQIDDYGSITVPAGKVTLTTADNLTSNGSGTPTPYYVAMSQGILLGDGSSISVAGERIDASQPSQAGLVAHTGGGSITLSEGTYLGGTVSVASGALLDLSGGYQVGATGSVSGGNAGSLSVSALSLTLDGSIDGTSLAGYNGGKLSVTTEAVSISHATSGSSNEVVQPAGTLGVPMSTYYLSDSRFAATGLSQLSIASYDDLKVVSGTLLEPSTRKYTVSASGGSSGAAATLSYQDVAPELAGASSLSLRAGVVRGSFQGQSFVDSDAHLILDPGAALQVLPGGSITLSGPTLDISGRVAAPGGNITLASTAYDVNLLAGSQLLAQGYNTADLSGKVASSVVNLTPHSGGTINIASQRDLNLAAGATIDVSGAPAVETLQAGSLSTLDLVTQAGKPGTLNLSYFDTLNLQGTIQARGYAPGLPGGTLSISSNDPGNPKELALSGPDIARYLGDGFDALSFTSLKGIGLYDLGNTVVPRSLTLDSPVLYAGGSDDVVLQSPWIQINNSSFPAQAPPTPGVAQLTLKGDWIDLNGAVQISGFNQTTLQASRDIRLSDSWYAAQGSSPSVISGKLELSGDLTLQANRIYPTSQSNFALVSDDASITVLGNGSFNPQDPVYSALGTLTLQAATGITQQGVLLAPMGSITLNSTGGRVLLADGSVISVAGSANVNIGTLDDDLNWVSTDKSGTKTNLSALPEKGITITGVEVVMQAGAVADLSGGGSVFSYQFQKGIDGSFDPLQVTGAGRSNRYVILPGSSYDAPGDALYLQANNALGLKAGVYTLLPESYAFVPGALIVSPVAAPAAGSLAVTPEGYPVVSGYSTIRGTSLQPALLSGYSVRLASDVMTEGHFETKSLAAGDGGSLTVNGATAILDGTVQAAAIKGFSGGSFSNQGAVINVVQTVGTDTRLIDASAAIPGALQGSVTINDRILDGSGFDTVTLGSASATNSITLADAAAVRAANVNLSSAADIRLGNGAQVEALASGGSGGALTLQTVSLSSGDQSLLHASDSIDITAGSRINLGGALTVDSGKLTLRSGTISFVDSAVSALPSDGLAIDQNLLAKVAGNSQLEFQSQGEIVFKTATSLTTAKSLTLDASLISGEADVTLKSDSVVLKNEGASSPVSPGAGTAQLSVSANQMTIDLGNEQVAGTGGITLDGFAKVALASSGDLTLKGRGVLATGGDLTLSAARVTTAATMTGAGADPMNAANPGDPATFYNADFRIDASAGNLAIVKGGGVAGSGGTPGGSLQLSARDIVQGGFIDLPSGSVTLNASDSVTLTPGSLIRAQGSKLLTQQGVNDLAKGTSQDGDYLYLPGGTISVTAAVGSVTLQKGATLDVSASDQGDAGTVAISAVTPGSLTSAVDLSGTLLGKAGSGLGGSFNLDAGDAASLNSGGLLQHLSAGGFDNSLQLRFRSGDLTISDQVQANQVTVAADGTGGGGSITLTGSAGISAASVELDARGSIDLKKGSLIDISSAASGTPGSAYLSAGDLDGSGNPVGSITMESGAVIKGAADGSGVVHFRALRNTADDTANGMNLTLNGSIQGGGKVEAEALRIYSYSGDLTIGSVAGTGVLSTATLQADSNAFMEQGSTVLAGLGSGKAGVTLLAGIEVRSSGSITLKTSSDWDFTSWRDATHDYYGVLTLRAADNLLIKTSLLDHPSANKGSLTVATAQDSWGFNLIGGADLTGVNLMSVVAGAAGSNSLVIDSGSGKTGVMVYTEKGSLRLASGGDASVGVGRNDQFTPYLNNLSTTVGTFSGQIEGHFASGLTVKGGSIQSEAGDIDLSVAGDLTLSGGVQNSNTVQGAIRTTGLNTRMPSSDPTSFAGGGDITLAVGGNITSGFTVWDAVSGAAKSWTANYTSSKTLQPTSGIATMAGGDLHITAGGDFFAQAGSFGKGDLTLLAGGDILGRLLNAQGTATVTSMGNLGLSPSYDVNGTLNNSQQQTVFELLGGKLSAAALGNVNLGTVFNPTLTDTVSSTVWHPSYTTDSSVRLISLLGDVSIYGTSAFTHYGTQAGSAVLIGGAQIFPGTLEVSAGGNINLWNSIELAPAPTGNLELASGGSILGAVTSNGWTTIQMIDVPVDYFYGSQANFGLAPAYSGKYSHGDGTTPLHAGDASAIQISAGADISGLNLFLPKEFVVSAGHDISQSYFVGENLNAADTSVVKAGHDLTLSVFTPAGGVSDYTDSGIEMGGPGSLLVQAGNLLDLGASQGVTSYGAAYNGSIADPKSSALYLVAGYNKSFGAEDISGFFADLLTAGTEYSTLLAAGNTADAKNRIVQARNGVINPYLTSSASDGEGTLSMTNSSINTNAGSSINIITSSSVDVGKGSITTASSSASTKNIGIYTAAGGGINIYAGSDVNINESKAMTFFGGDITVWSDTGNINAGRGSATAVNAQPPQYVIDPVTGKLVLKFTPPAVGSGIRALTYNPNLTPAGTLETPKPGDVSLFAPQGVIDAGEAGIAGGKVILGATEVLNSKNISFTAGSVGVASSSEAGVSLGALAGSGSVAENSKMIEQSSSLGSPRDQGTTQANAVDDFMSQWLDLRIISFDGDDSADDGTLKKDKKKK